MVDRKVIMNGVGKPCRNLLVAATGSIHCIQLPQYIMALRASFAEHIRVVMTQSATQMCPTHVLELLLDEPVETTLWGTQTKAPHIRATRWADLILVLPATANCLGKASHGIADDLVSTALLAATSPIIFAPAMNPSMWNSPAVQRNIAVLRQDGHYMLPPERITSLTTGLQDEGLGPTPQTLLPFVWHAYMKTRQQSFFPRATAELPSSPSQLLPQRTAGAPTRASRARRKDQLARGPIDIELSPPAATTR